MKNYFVYLPEPRAAAPWDCCATAAGYSRVPPGGVYPPLQHPLDHHFAWSNGRRLHAYQIVLISEGAGWFESGAGRRRHRIEAGTVFLLFPGVWHRYAPDPATGWVEHWLECRGRAFERAQKLGLIRPDKPVRRPGLDPDLLYAFERCHALAQRPAARNQAVLPTLGLYMLALLQTMTATGSGAPPIQAAIHQAQLHIAAHYQEAITMEALAGGLNVSYSWFRHAFRMHTGLSPKQYQIQLRLHKAREFLANTAKSVKEIAELLGFDSPYHLSAQFKRHTGQAPIAWRHRLRRAPPAKHAAPATL